MPCLPRPWVDLWHVEAESIGLLPDQRVFRYQHPAGSAREPVETRKRLIHVSASRQQVPIASRPGRNRPDGAFRQIPLPIGSQVQRPAFFGTVLMVILMVYCHGHSSRGRGESARPGRPRRVFFCWCLNRFYHPIRSLHLCVHDSYFRMGRLKRLRRLYPLRDV